MKSANSIVPRSPSAFIVSLRTPAREDFRRRDPGFSGQEKGQGENQPCLVGGLEHVLHNIWDVIIPIDELHHFSRWSLHHQMFLPHV